MAEPFDWSQRRCPINALKPLSFAGIQAETMVIGVIMIAVGKPFFGIIKVALAAIVLGFIYEKISSRRMPKFLPYWVSSKSGHPWLKRWCPSLVRQLNTAWRVCGLPYAPSIQNRYEP